MRILCLSFSVALLVLLMPVDMSGNIASAQAENKNGEDAAALAKSCTACHGARGVSSSPEWPNLAGQKAGYLADQIMAFRDGTRLAPTMLPYVKDLSDEQIQQLAHYFANLQTPGNASTASLQSAGANVRARCISCHGVGGVTVNQQWPNLAGQKREYLQKRLLAFRSGEQTAPLMNVIANELSEQQINDVAEYYSQSAY